MANNEKETERIKESIWREFKSKLGLANLSDFEATGLQRATEIQRTKLNMQEAISSLKNKISMIEEKDLKGTCERMESQMEGDKQELNSLKESEKELKQTLEKGIADMEKLTSEKEENDAKIKDIERNVRERKKKINK